MSARVTDDHDRYRAAESRLPSVLGATHALAVK